MLFRDKSNGDIVIFLNESEGYYHRFGYLARIVNVSKEQTILIKDEVQKKNELDKLEPISEKLKLSILSDKFKYELYEIFKTEDNDIRYVFKRNDHVLVGIDKNSSLIGFTVRSEDFTLDEIKAIVETADQLKRPIGF